MRSAGEPQPHDPRTRLHGVVVPAPATRAIVCHREQRGVELELSVEQRRVGRDHHATRVKLRPRKDLHRGPERPARIIIGFWEISASFLPARG